MLRDDETLHVRLLFPFDLLFTLRRWRDGRGYYQQQFTLPESKLRGSVNFRLEDKIEQTATLIRYLQQLADEATGEPRRVTCPRCGWLAGERVGGEPSEAEVERFGLRAMRAGFRGDGAADFRCFNCQHTWSD